MDVGELKKEYRRKKADIEKRLDDFRKALLKDDKDIFAELAYCICTAQAKAEEADRAVEDLKKRGLLYKGGVKDIKPYLRGVRFWNKKAHYIVEARRTFTRSGRMELKRTLKDIEPLRLRETLVSKVLGIGYKEASHFLRNIGLGKDLAIVDRYILRSLVRLGVIRSTSASMTKNRYLEIEDKMRRFADKIMISMEHLDLLLWSNQTGRIFK